VDTTGQQQPARFMGQPKWTTNAARGSYALELNATARECMVVKPTIVSPQGSAFLWIQTLFTSTASLLSFSVVTSTTVGSIELRLFQGRLQGYLYTGTVGSGIWGGTRSPAINDGAWHHVGMTRNGTAMSLFVNGTLVASGTLGLTEAVVGQLAARCDTLTVGCRYSGNSSASPLHVTGSVDEVEVYDFALTPAQIARRCELCVTVWVGAVLSRGLPWFQL
jgi:hypothetical protein